MADPHIVSELDGVDRFTVVVYRAGLGLAGVGLCWMAVSLLQGGDPHAGQTLVVAGALAAIGHLHLYVKFIRQIIVTAGCLGGALVFGGRGLVAAAGFGFLCVSLSALALKEQFCFRIPGLRLVPLFLAVGVFAGAFGAPFVAGIADGVAGVVLLTLTLAKARQPLHFDIGDKTRYQM